MNASAANGSFSLGLALDRLALHVDALGGRDVDRRRQVVDDRVEHGLHALVLERGAAEHRHELERERAGADRGLDLVDGELLVVEVLLQQVVVDVRDRLEQLVARARRRRPAYSAGMSTTSNFAPSVSSSSGHTMAFIATRSMTPRKSLSAPIGSWTTAGTASRRSRIIVDAALEVGADAVHLVDEAEPRHVVLVGLAPHRLGLRLDAGDRVEHRDRAVEDAQRALDLDGEVDVAGRVDDVDLAVAPLRGRGGRGDRDAALLLLDHVVHDRGAFVHLTDLVGAAGVVEDALGRRGLARVDVSHDPDVAGLFEGEFACHLCVLRGGSFGVRCERRAVQQSTGRTRCSGPGREARVGPARRHVAVSAVRPPPVSLLGSSCLDRSLFRARYQR